MHAYIDTIFGCYQKQESVSTETETESSDFNGFKPKKTTEYGIFLRNKMKLGIYRKQKQPISSTPEAKNASTWWFVLSIYYCNEIKLGFSNTGQYRLKQEFVKYFIQKNMILLRETMEPNSI